jgi:thioredoxin reductase (NADPH)
LIFLYKSGGSCLCKYKNSLFSAFTILRQRVFKVPNLTVRYNTEATVVGAGTVRVGDETISNASLQRLVGGRPRAADLFGVEQDDRGFVLTDGQFHSSRPNVFAVGDVRSGSIKRVAVAAGEGIAVGHIVAGYLRGR